jgi:hypothetical protein
MTHRRKGIVMRNTPSGIVWAVLILQGLILLAICRAPVGPSAAYGDLPNNTPDFQEMIHQLKDLNSKTDHLIGLLEGGQLQVHVAPADDNNKAAK